MTKISNHNANQKRNRKGIKTALTGLGFNLVLGIGKLVAGLVTSSIGIMSDGINNLSDVGANIVTVSSFAVSSKKADSKHPFGHGRFEYIAGVIMSALIIVMAVELVISSITRLVSNETQTKFSIVALVVMLVSVFAKGFMAVFYWVRNRTIHSDTLKASMLDSGMDAIASTSVAVAFALDGKVSFPFDSIAGIFCALLIAFGGVKLIISTVNKLMGGGRDEEVERLIANLVSQSQQALGYHDLRVHDYGAGRKVASVDVELDRTMSFDMVHKVAHEIEIEAMHSGVSLVVHPDPVDTTDQEQSQMRHQIICSLEKFEGNATFHEFEIDREKYLVSLHLRLSEDLMRIKEVVTADIIQEIKSVLENYDVKVEYDFL